MIMFSNLLLSKPVNIFISTITSCLKIILKLARSIFQKIKRFYSDYNSHKKYTISPISKKNAFTMKGVIGVKPQNDSIPYVGKKHDQLVFAETLNFFSQHSSIESVCDEMPNSTLFDDALLVTELNSKLELIKDSFFEDASDKSDLGHTEDESLQEFYLSDPTELSDTYLAEVMDSHRVDCLTSEDPSLNDFNNN